MAQDHPVRRILFVGDSLGHGVSAHMDLLLAAHGRAWRNAVVEPYVFTGGGVIVRPGQDLLATLQTRLQQPDPPVDIVVLMAGVNDVGMPIGGGTFYDDRWQQAYAERMREMIRTATDRGIPTYWVGTPVLGRRMFAEPFEAHVRRVQYTVLSEEGCAAVLIDLYKLTAVDGAYAEFRDFGNGRAERFRDGDGIHFSPNGYRLIANHILDRIEADLMVHLRPGVDWSSLEE